jgi:hypothetical protein
MYHPDAIESENKWRPKLAIAGLLQDQVVVAEAAVHLKEAGARVYSSKYVPEARSLYSSCMTDGYDAPFAVPFPACCAGGICHCIPCETTGFSCKRNDRHLFPYERSF